MFRCVLFVCFAEWILWLIVCQPQYYFVCVSGPVFVCVHVCGGQAVPMKWVTWPMHRVAKGFSVSLNFLPSNLSRSFHVPKPLSLRWSLWDVHRSARACGILQEESGTCRGSDRGNSRGSHGAGEPSVHTEWDSPTLWALRGHPKLSG